MKFEYKHHTVKNEADLSKLDELEDMYYEVTRQKL